MLSNTAGFPFGGDDGVDRLDAGSDVGHVRDADRHPGRRALDHDLADLLRIGDLALDQAEIELMVLLQQSGRVNQVGPAHGIENVGDGNTRRQQLRRIRRDVKLRLLPALHQQLSPRHPGD